MVRSTVCLDRRLLQRLDEWAERNGFPVGPGHRTKALEAILRERLGFELEARS